MWLFLPSLSAEERQGHQGQQGLAWSHSRMHPDHLPASLPSTGRLQMVTIFMFSKSDSELHQGQQLLPPPTLCPGVVQGQLLPSLLAVGLRGPDLGAQAL